MSKDKTPYFSAQEYRPLKAGPYECRMVLPPQARHASRGGADTTHLRWWDGERMRWSFPLGVDPDEEYAVKAPPEDMYPQHHVHQAHFPQFDWRGYNEDQDEL